MANPQLENGYTSIANEIMEALIENKFTGQELRTILFVIRKTYGFHKKDDFISLTQIAKAINSSRVRCSQIVKRLVFMKILTVYKNINGIGKSYIFNKDFDKWEGVNKNINGLEKYKRTVYKNINGGVYKNINHKRKYLNISLKKEYMCKFNEFYSLYPKKKSKQNAIKAWMKLKIDSELFGEIMEALKSDIESKQWNKDGGEFIPLPATWINGKRWEDSHENILTQKEKEIAEHKAFMDKYRKEPQYEQ